MKKLINKIRNWFSRKPIYDTDYLFDRCDSLAKKYGTRCSSICVTKHYYPHSGETSTNVYLHTLNRQCESIRFPDKIDIDKILSVYELMLIKGYGKT